jgi:hypothetical protein
MLPIAVIKVPVVEKGSQDSLDESVLVEVLSDTRFRVVCSAAIARDVVAGDELQYDPEESRYRRIKEGENFSARLLAKNLEAEPFIRQLADTLGGVIDGKVTGRDGTLFVLTFPKSGNASSIQSALQEAGEAGNFSLQAR